MVGQIYERQDSWTMDMRRFFIHLPKYDIIFGIVIVYICSLTVFICFSRVFDVTLRYDGFAVAKCQKSSQIHSMNVYWRK